MSKETTEFWAGEFGDQYTERNVVQPEQRMQFWRDLLDHVYAGTDMAKVSAMEVGCNRGHNMRALQELGIGTVCGIDVNDQALGIARGSGMVVDKREARELIGYAEANSFDLVFTAGVLIHVPPQDLHEVMMQIAMVARGYVLAIEYEDTHEVEVEYRGNAARLWRRPYGHIYTRLGLRLVRKWPAPEFDNATAWLFRKV